MTSSKYTSISLHDNTMLSWLDCTLVTQEYVQQFNLMSPEDIILGVGSCSWSYGSWIYKFPCNQCLSQLTLWVRVAHGEVYSVQHYVIMCVNDLRQVGGFLRVFRFHHQQNWSPWYIWNIVEGGVKHPNPLNRHVVSFLSFYFSVFPASLLLVWIFVLFCQLIVWFVVIDFTLMEWMSHLWMIAV